MTAANPERACSLPPQAPVAGPLRWRSSVGNGPKPSGSQRLQVFGAYLVVTLLQSNVVTPMVLGHRLALNPVAIFIGLAFWLWIWGLPGAFIAVPVLATLKICCDHIEMLAPVGEFLGE